MLDPNPGAARQTSVCIGSEEVLIRQAAATNCSFSLGSSWYLGTPGTYIMTIPAPPGCAWSVTGSPDWVIVSGTTSGTGPAQFYYNLNANGNYTRSGTITLSGGQTFQLNQLPGNCSGSGSNSSWFPFAGGSYTFDLVAPTGCPWTVASTANWVRVNSALSGTGSATVSYTIDPNLGAARSATLFASFPGGTVTRTIQQPPYVYNGPCTYSAVYPTDPASSNGGAFYINLNTQAGCPWTIVSNSTWAVPSVTSGYGPATLLVLLAANTAPTSRTATLSVAGQTINLTQNGVACSIGPLSSGSYFPPPAGTYSFGITAPDFCPVTITTPSSFVQILSKPSFGSGIVTIALTQNDGQFRTGVLIIGQYTYTITQFGNPCAPSFAPNSSWFPATGGSFILNVLTGGGCSWSVTTSAPFAQLTAPSGVGSGTFVLTLQPNTTGAYREGQLLVGSGTLFTIRQIAQ